jgi:hypothetical protein
LWRSGSPIMSDVAYIPSDVHTLHQIISVTKEKGGGTFKFINGTVMEANHPMGFYVSRLKPSVVCPLDRFGINLRNFLEDNSLLLKLGLLGTWIDEDKVYIEITDYYKSRLEALEVAKERQQIAVWDIANNCEIRIK